jgi:uncharacterized DUF497 family protein
MHSLWPGDLRNDGGGVSADIPSKTIVSNTTNSFVTLGFLGDLAVSIVHTETPTTIRVISFRKATRHETSILFQSLKN